MARGLFATWNLTAKRGVMLLAVVASGIGAILDAGPAQSRERAVTPSDTLGVTARQPCPTSFKRKTRQQSIAISVSRSYSMTRASLTVLLG
jgi:hypothetical protein